jgi:hypothetical protein
MVAQIMEQELQMLCMSAPELTVMRVGKMHQGRAL